MEWQGINLSHYYERKWVRKNTLYLSGGGLVLLFSTLLFFFLQVIIDERVEQIHQQTKIIAERRNLLSKHKINIEQLKQKYVKQNSDNQLLSLSSVDFFIHYLENFPVKGVVSSVLLFHQDATKIKISGSFIHQQQLHLLENQLKKNMQKYHIDYLQGNQNHKMDFGVTIEVNDEKVVN